MKNFTKEIKISTNDKIDFIDITERVRDACAASGIANGMLTVFTSHTTSAVKINEKCERLQQDMTSFLLNTVPELKYRHNEQTVDDRPNARSHLMSLLLNASETVPVSGGAPMLGGWQSVFFIELDGPREERKITIKLIGD